MLRELDAREQSGVAVTLAWDDEEDLVVLKVVGCGENLAGPVERTRALDAFWHPFAYLGPETAVEVEEPHSVKAEAEPEAVA